MVNPNPINLNDLVVGAAVNGHLLVSSYTAKPENSTSKAPMNGKAYLKGKVVTFKTWDAVINKMFAENNLTGGIIEVTGTVGFYGGANEITLTRAIIPEGDIDINPFYKSVDIDTVFGQFINFANANLSSAALTVLGGIFGTEGLYEPFKLTFAGAKMHDAQVGGLMNHTLKMLRIALTLIENDPRLDMWKDMILLNIILHDIGKIYELKGPTYTMHSFVTHRTMGLEITVRNKELISSNLGESFYYHILAVQQGHHGDYGDAPTTIWAYLIHLVDMLECNTTGFLDNMERGDYKLTNGQKTVWNHGKDLVV